MNKLVAGSIAIAMFLIVGCGARGPKLASSAEDVAGTWKTTIGATEYQFNGDGTFVSTGGCCGIDKGEYRFEGTRLFLESATSNRCDSVVDALGTYEVELLENGNLKFTAIEDECLTRAGLFQGRTIAAEWEPVP